MCVCVFFVLKMDCTIARYPPTKQQCACVYLWVYLMMIVIVKRKYTHTHFFYAKHFFFYLEILLQILSRFQSASFLRPFHFFAHTGECGVITKTFAPIFFFFFFHAALSLRNPWCYLYADVKWSLFDGRSMELVQPNLLIIFAHEIFLWCYCGKG